LMQKITELQQAAREHQLVLEAFGKVESSRRCFRLVGGVLIEQTVAEVQPAILSNKTKIEDFVTQLNETLQTKSTHIERLSATQLGTAKKQQQPKTNSNPSSSSGVLV
jgi:prefoldin subunit 2